MWSIDLLLTKNNSHCGPLPYSVNRFGGDFWSKRVAVCHDFVQAYCNHHFSYPNQILGHTRQIPFKTDHRNRFSKNNVLNSSEVKNTTRNSTNRISWIFWLERSHDFSARLWRTVVRKSRVIFEHYTKLTIGSDFRFFEFVGTKYTEFEAPIRKERQHVFHSSGFGGRIFHGLLNQSTGFPREMISLCNYKPYGT